MRIYIFCLLHSTKDKSAISPGQMKKLTSELKEDFDYILLDCPAGIEQGFHNAIAGADRALVVTTPEVSAIRHRRPYHRTAGLGKKRSQG